MVGGFGGFRGDKGPRSVGGKEDCPHNGGWDQVAAPAGAGQSSGGLGRKQLWWKCRICGMTVESDARPQAEDFLPDEEDDEDNEDED